MIEIHKKTAWIWIKIILATIEGRLGHYSGLSPEIDRICVHFANQYKERERIGSQLRQLGVQYMDFVPIVEENDLIKITKVNMIDGRIKRIQLST